MREGALRAAGGQAGATLSPQQLGARPHVVAGELISIAYSLFNSTATSFHENNPYRRRMAE